MRNMAAQAYDFSGKRALVTGAGKGKGSTQFVCGCMNSPSRSHKGVIKVTWNETLSWASCTKTGAVRETLWGVVGGESTYFLVVSCRVPGSNLTGSLYGDSA